MKIFITFIVFLISASICAAATYSYASHGSDWTGMCSTGQSQSPVNLANTTKNEIYISNVPVSHWSVSTFGVDFDKSILYAQAELDELFLYYYVFNHDDFAKRKYNCDRFEIHTQGQHQINGVDYELEITFDCLEEDDSKQPDQRVPAKLSLLLQEQTTDHKDHFLKPFTELIPLFKSRQTAGEKQISYARPYFFHQNLINLYTHTLSEEVQLFNYQGSLTKPGCLEGYEWHVMKLKTEVSTSQLSALRGLFTNTNNRAVQNLNSRKVQQGIHEKFYLANADGSCSDTSKFSLDKALLNIDYDLCVRGCSYYGFLQDQTTMKCKNPQSQTDCDNKYFISSKNNVDKIQTCVPSQHCEAFNLFADKTKEECVIPQSQADCQTNTHAKFFLTEEQHSGDWNICITDCALYSLEKDGDKCVEIDDDDGLSVGIIILIVVICIVVVVAIIFLVRYLILRKSKQNQYEKQSQQQSNAASPFGQGMQLEGQSESARI